MLRLLPKLVLAMTVGLASLELALRMLQPVHAGANRLLYQATASVRWDRADTIEQLVGMTAEGYRPNRLRSDFVSNSKGLRTIEYSEEKPLGTLRVLALGDSFTYASGAAPYDALWPVQLERRLQEQTERRVEVLNLGMPGVGPNYQVRLWEIEGSRLDADLAILAFFVGNDFTDARGARAVESPLDRLAQASLAVRLVRNLYLRHTLTRQVNPADQSQSRPNLAGRGGVRYEEIVPRYTYHYDPEDPPMSADAFAHVERVRFQICRKRRMDGLMPAVADALRELRDHAAASGVPLFVVIIPDRYQLEPELRASIIEQRGGRAESWDIDLPQRRLVAFLEEEGIPYLDLLPAFRASEEVLYRFRDTHWNVKGLTRAVDLLLPEVVSLLDGAGLLEASSSLQAGGEWVTPAGR